MIKLILKELRIKHYVKNTMVFLPLVFSLRLTEGSSVLRSALAFLMFCAGSSAIYVINDLADRERDRLHPVKRGRPIASGDLSTRTGVAIISACFASAALLAVFSPVPAAFCLLLYIIINVLYCFVLKNYALTDVFSIAAGFLLRVMGGAAAVGVPVSDWLLLTVMSLSLFLGFGKRRGELAVFESENDTVRKIGTRKVLVDYNASFLDKSMYSMMTLSIAFYTLWTIDAEVTTHLGTDKLIWTVPVVIAGLLRYSLLVEGSGADGDPTNVILTDKPILAIIAAYIIFVTLLIFLTGKVAL